MIKDPDFFLTSAGEYRPLTVPRACRSLERLRDASRDDYMLVEIDPPLIGQSFGLGDKDIAFLLLSTRHQGYTLYPVTEWPAYVYVSRILDEQVLGQQSFAASQVELIAWGQLFPSLEAANSHVREINNGW